MNELTLFILVCVFVLLVLQFGYRYLVEYQIHPKRLEIRFLKIPLAKINYQEIENVQLQSWSEKKIFPGDLLTWRLGNKLIAKDYVVIHKKRGLVKILITPANAEAFVRQLKQKIIDVN